MNCIDIQGTIPCNDINPTTAKANCGSLLVHAWGDANADKIAAELTMSIEASGTPIGIDGYLRQAQIDCASANRQGRAYGVVVEFAAR